MMILPICQELRCILWLGICMMTLYAADYTLINLQKTLTSSMADDHPGFNMEGYTLTAILYSVFTFSLLVIGPYITYAVGPRLTLFLSSIGVALFLATYLSEIPWVIYLGNVVSGISQGLLWPAEGYYLIHNSSPKNIGRNSSIFWSLFALAELIGNIFVYFVFKGKMYIDRSTRNMAIYCLLGINVVSIIEFAFLPKPTTAFTATGFGPLKTIGKCWKIMFSSRIMWLTPTFIYVGLQQTFWMGVYSTSLGFTLAFGDLAKEMMGLNGIFLGIGGFAGSIVPLLLSGWIARHKYGRTVIIMVGCIGGLFTFLVAFLNLPNESVFNNTFQESLIRPPSNVLALAGSFTLLFGDSCLNTQIYACLGDYYRDYSTEACAIYKFLKNLSIAVFYFACSYLGLYSQLTIMAVMAVVACLCFYMAERDKQPKTPTHSYSVSNLQRMTKELYNTCQCKLDRNVKTDAVPVEKF